MIRKCSARISMPYVCMTIKPSINATQRMLNAISGEPKDKWEKKVYVCVCECVSVQAKKFHNKAKNKNQKYFCSTQSASANRNLLELQNVIRSKKKFNNEKNSHSLALHACLVAITEFWVFNCWRLLFFRVFLPSNVSKLQWNVQFTRESVKSGNVERQRNDASTAIGLSFTV